MSLQLQPLSLPHLCELSEARIAASEINSAPGHVRDTCGLAMMERYGAVATAASRIDVLAVNRVVGLGVNAPATEDDLDAFIDFFRSHSVPRFFVQVCPDAQPAELPDMLRAKGLRHYNNWAKLYRSIPEEPVAEADCNLRIEKIGEEHADAFARLISAAFNFPDAAGAWVASLVNKPEWHHYMAFDGTTPVATAAIAIADNICWLGFAATDPAYRRRGAQSALITRRINDARELGCRWLTVETAEDTPERPNPSYHNVLRMGFVHAYLRLNWLWVA
jgi:GNAT superfamily N-acetyltransferase